MHNLQRNTYKHIFLPQVKVYSEFGGKPQTWDQHQKGTIILTNNDYDCYSEDHGKEAMRFLDFPKTSHTFIILSWAEYVFVSTSVALVIAKFFPAVYNQIVSRATRLEHQSFYWGTVVVSNTFIYGLLFAAMREWSISAQAIYLVEGIYTQNSIIVTCIQEMIIHVILFVGDVVASLRNNSGLSIPRGMAKVVIIISFWWAYCICCSRRCKIKDPKVLVMFSFMMFIHRIIMDVISFTFMMFIEISRVTITTIAFLYISLMVFIILSVSFTLFIMLNGSNAGMSIVLGGVCTLISVFGAVTLIVVVYMIVITSLKLKGFAGILTGLIPSICLSAVSWYIKKRLLKREAGQPSTTSGQDQPECGPNNELEREDERMLLH